ncbi:MAG: PmoA family protein [Rhodothermaceae bacterium]|nr:PmoA family protein [Rhodothermaceae bacterium]
MKALIPSIILIVFAVIAFAYASTPPSDNNGGVQVVHREDKKRVDVFIDDTLFTSYLFSEEGSSLKKPVLYPLRTASGIDITRGYPYERRAGERVDHPHHVGHWLNYGDVNGLDFWNHSESTPEERKPTRGTIVHRKVLKAESGENRGVLEVEMDWLKPDGSVILTETTQFTFKKSDNKRMVDRITTLTAPQEEVNFTDNKEGMLAIRVTRALEHPSDEALLLTNEMGKPMEEEVLDNVGVSGQYLSSEGLSGTGVWGTRANWMILSGIVQDENVTVAIIDHPSNPGYPTYWHARGYGLFAANPLGQKVFSKGAEELNFSLKKGESTTFQYRIVILSNDADPTHTIELLSKAFSEV